MYIEASDVKTDPRPTTLSDRISTTGFEGWSRIVQLVMQLVTSIMYVRRKCQDTIGRITSLRSNSGRIRLGNLRDPTSGVSEGVVNIKYPPFMDGRSER